MSFLPAISSWLKRNRTSARMAFLLRMIAMALGSLFSLLWMRLLLRAMGDPLLGLFQNFQALTRLGGLGDFGITGALSLKTGTMLGSGDEKGLRGLLASARTLFLLLACGLCILFVGLSPWLPKWLNFESVAGAGSMTLLFVYGGMSLMLFIIGGYFACLNYAHATVTWPILPTVFFVQVLAPFFHWRLALLHMPLWVQLLPYLGSAATLAFLSWALLKWSHPWLGDVIPLKQDRSEWKILAGASGWVYLISVGATIYFTTDRLVIGAVIGTGMIPTYQANYKVCELCVTLIVTASFVSLPKITQWIASPQEADRQRLLVQLKRLSVFEVVLGCGSALGYLAFNNLFIRVWLDKAHQASLIWQFAFACNLAVTVSGNTGIQLSMRAGENGLKLAGLAVAGTGLLNLALSILSVKMISGEEYGIGGVAAATVVAQSISSICLGIVTCRYLKMPAFKWTVRCWLLPLGFTLIAATFKVYFPHDSLRDLGVIAAVYLVLFLVLCRLAGMNLQLLRSELTEARALFFQKT
jgi:O-antigen/teichoic acid export membrane protein